MRKRHIIAGFVFGCLLITFLWWYVSSHSIAVLQPAGRVGEQERQLVIYAVILSIIVVVPVYVMTLIISWRYRESHHKTHAVKYQPNWAHSGWLEAAWWGIPGVIILILSSITWQSSHSLDPYRPLASTQPPLTIQVVALDWKWLFIYPEQHVASVNEVALPVGRPINFNLTSDSVMNSFWIPQLGGQIYAMPGMSTQLHLLADHAGTYYGSPANISGQGFATMTFTAKAVTTNDFTAWVQHAKASNDRLDTSTYTRLAAPSQQNPVTYYATTEDGLYNEIVMKYMLPAGEAGHGAHAQ